MLDKVVVAKRKRQTIVVRVDENTKQYVQDTAKRLGVSVSAYVLQLIENDRNPNTVTVRVNEDVLNRLKAQSQNGEVDVSLNRLSNYLSGMEVDDGRS